MPSAEVPSKAFYMTCPWPSCAQLLPLIKQDYALLHALSTWGIVLFFKQKEPPSYTGIHPKQGLRRPFSHSGWEENRRADRPQKARGEVQGSNILQPVTQMFPDTVSLCEWVRAEKIAHFRRNHDQFHLCQSGKPEGKPVSIDTHFAVFSSTSARSEASCSVWKDVIRQNTSGNSHTSDCLHLHL